MNSEYRIDGYIERLFPLLCLLASADLPGRCIHFYLVARLVAFYCYLKYSSCEDP